MVVENTVQNANRALLSLQAITCERSDRVLFKDLSFQLFEKEILQIEGANGAGKTSLLRIICGFLNPVAGKVVFKGSDVLNDPITFHQDLLFIGHQHAVKAELTVEENLAFYRGVCDRPGTHAIPEAIKEVGLYGYNEVHCSDLSAGQRRRVALARLLISPMPLWILDEPFVALDKKAVLWLENVIINHATAGGAVIFTSHQDFSSNYDIKSLRL